MKKAILLLSLVLLAAFSVFAVTFVAEDVHTHPAEVRPGEPFAVFTVMTSVNESFYAALYNGQGRRVAQTRFFYYTTGYKGASPAPVRIMAALLAVPSTAGSGVFTLAIEERNGENLVKLVQKQFSVLPRAYESERIPLNQANTDIRTVPDPEKTAQAEELAAIIASLGNVVYADGVFITPIPANTRKTSVFGARRVYVYANGDEDTALHAGIDYGVPTGTPVHACARGRVVLAKFRISTGNSVVLEHFPGVYSIYYHMDSIAVRAGDIIEQNAVLGHSGSTGLATGPHLHWELRVSRENTDPEAFTKNRVLDKNLFLDIMELR